MPIPKKRLPIDLTKGTHNLKIEYLENTEQASFKFNIERLSLAEAGLTPIEILQAKLEPYSSLDELGDDDKDGLLNIFEIINDLLDDESVIIEDVT